MLPYIGSSLDPDMEDIAELERALQGAVTRDHLGRRFLNSLLRISEGGPLPIDGPDVPPSDFDEEIGRWNHWPSRICSSTSAEAVSTTLTTAPM